MTTPPNSHKVNRHLQPVNPPQPTKSFRKAQTMRAELRPEHLQEIQRIMLLVDHHQQIIAGLDNQAKTLLAEKYQIDLSDGKWSMNLQTGVMERRDGKS